MTQTYTPRPNSSVLNDSSPAMEDSTATKCSPVLDSGDGELPLQRVLLFFFDINRTESDVRLVVYFFRIMNHVTRRLCPGRHLASSTLWLVVASVLAVFDVTKAKDESGNDIEVDPVYLDSAVT